VRLGLGGAVVRREAARARARLSRGTYHRPNRPMPKPVAQVQIHQRLPEGKRLCRISRTISATAHPAVKVDVTIWSLASSGGGDCGGSAGTHPGYAAPGMPPDVVYLGQPRGGRQRFMHMTTTKTRTDASLAAALRISVSRLARRLRAQRATSGLPEAALSETQFAALSALEKHHAMTPGELAEHEKVQPPSMTRVIAVLEERKLVYRSPHPTDRRQAVLTVTEEGRALVQRVRRRKDAWLARHLAELTAEERAVLRAAVPILEKLSQSALR
jgi:DNA-binding MarR family transcriptional regulator